MSQRFAVVQTRLEPLERERLQRALRGVPGLTPYDAGTVCSEGDGILCRNFSAEQAAALRANLKAEGVEVEIVEESRLPVLPPAKLIHRVELTPEALQVDDLLKGQISIAWEQVEFLAAGSVQLTQFVRQGKTIEKVRLSPGYGSIIPIPHTESRVEYSSKASLDWFLRAEIVLAGAAVRYGIEAEHFNFTPLGEGVTHDLAGNFCLLVRGLASHASKARLSRGAASIVSDACEFVYYPRKKMFEDEVIWMLWRARDSSDQAPA